MVLLSTSKLSETSYGRLPILLNLWVILYTRLINLVYLLSFLTISKGDWPLCFHIMFALFDFLPNGVMCHHNTYPDEQVKWESPTLTFNKFPSSKCQIGPLKFEKQCSFYLHWICKFLNNTSLKRIITQFIPISKTLLVDHNVTLSPLS